MSSRLNRKDNPNAMVGLFMLMLLAVLAGPNTLPRLISDVIPFADAGVPCDWLRTGEDRAYHQSLLGRDINTRTESPISLSVSTSSVATAQIGAFVITIEVVNKTLAPVPILVESNRLILSETSAESGFGVTLNPASVIAASGEIGPGYPEERIHILGPRQRCIHRVTVSNVDNAGFLSTLTVSNPTIKAFYRNNLPGQVTFVAEDQPFVDQGLWVGVVESPPQSISNVASP